MSEQTPEPLNANTHASDQEVDTALLRAWPLPDPEGAADKDERGRVLIIGGCTQMPGAVILAALGAMRAGAGKICVATSGHVTAIVAQALPEARVIGLDENSRGGLHIESIKCLPHDVDGVLLGPGMQDEAATIMLTQAVLEHCGDATVVLDALAMSTVVHSQVALAHSEANSTAACRSIVITPHPGEMAHLRREPKEQIQQRLRATALDSAARWQVVVAMKSATTFIATPTGAVWRHEGNNAGLATSGSGDVLAGIIAGLCARGVPAAQATVWGVALHARSGALLAKQFGPVGYLAREIPDYVPRLMHKPELADRNDE